MRAGARCLLLVTFALVLASGPAVLRAARAAAVLAELTGAQLPSAAALLLGPITEAAGEVQVETPGPRPGTSTVAIFRTRRYQRQGAAAERRPGVVLLHGVHPRGIDEPRLVAFARSLARAGLDVLTPELPELLAYRLDSATSVNIRELAAAHAAATHTAAVGVIGISFAGGLALIAAADQAAPAPIGFVATVGAHDDLMRLCHYYARREVRGPAGEPVDVAPHPYGARVMIREHLDRFFAIGELGLARRALDLYLRDQAAQALKLASGLSPAGQAVMNVLLDTRSSEALSELIETAAEAASPQLMAASPAGKLRGLQVPVFLLHGEGDPIIPSIELRYLARDVPKRWLREAIITPLLRHAEFPQPPKPQEAWELVRFIKEMFEAAGSAADVRSPSEE